MSLIPDEILTNEEINQYILECNERIHSILGEDNFKIERSELPGIGMIIALWLRSIESGFGIYISPLAAFKKIITDTKPINLIKELKTTIKEIKDFFSDPLQSVLDELINKKINKYTPFSFEINHTPNQNNSISNEFRQVIDEHLLNTINKASPSENKDINYSFFIRNNFLSDPINGEAVVNAEDIKNVNQIKISKISSSGEDISKNLKSLMKDELIILSIEDESSIWKIKKIKDYNNYVLIDIELIEFEEKNNNEKTKIIPFNNNLILNISILTSTGFSMDPDDPRFNPEFIPLKKFMTKENNEWGITIPLSSLIDNSPFKNILSIRIGDQKKIPSDHITNIAINSMFDKINLDQGEVLNTFLWGLIPSLDFNKIEEREEKEIDKRDAFSAIKLKEIAIRDPVNYIKIILNYIKLLLLPVSLVFGVLKNLLSYFTSPIKVIKLVIKVTSNPLGFFCDLLTEASLSSLEGYITPIIAPLNMTYDEAKLTREGGKERGLKILLSDIICGKFKNKIDSYIPNNEILQSISGKIKEFKEEDDLFYNEDKENKKIHYRIKFKEGLPDPGEINMLNDESNISNKILISKIDFNNNYNNFLSLNIEKIISLQIDGNEFIYDINSIIFHENYIEIDSMLLYSSEFNINELKEKHTIRNIDVLVNIKQRDKNFQIIGNINSLKKDILKINEDTDLKNKLEEIVLKNEKELLFNSISIKNKNKYYLFLIENYLPIKLISVWEGTKGILALFLGVIQTTPKLLPNVIKNIFNSPNYISGNPLNNYSIERLNYILISEFIEKLANKEEGMLLSMDNNIYNTEMNEAINELLYSNNTEELIEDSLLELDNPENSLNFSHEINGEKITFKEFIERLKIQIMLYNSLNNKIIYIHPIEEITRLEKIEDQINYYKKLNNNYYTEDIDNNIYQMYLLSSNIVEIVNNLYNYLDNLSPYQNNNIQIYRTVNNFFSISVSKNLKEKIRNNLKIIEYNNEIIFEIFNKIKQKQLGVEYLEILNKFKEIEEESIKVKKEIITIKNQTNDLIKLISYSFTIDNISKKYIEDFLFNINKLTILNNKKLKNIIEELAFKYNNFSKKDKKKIKNIDKLNFYQTIKDKIKSHKYNIIWKSENDYYNYFKDPPFEINNKSKFLNKSISGTIIENYINNQITKIKNTKEINNGEGIKIPVLRSMILDEILEGSNIIRNIN